MFNSGSMNKTANEYGWGYIVAAILALVAVITVILIIAKTGQYYQFP